MVVHDASQNMAAPPNMRLEKFYATLLQIHRAIARAASMQELFQEACRVCVAFGSLDLAWIGRPDPKGERMQVVAAEGPFRAYVEDLQVSLHPESPYARGTTGTCFRECRTVVCEAWHSPEAEPLTLPWRDRARVFGINSSAAVPIFRRGRIFATFTLYSRDPAFFQPDQMELLEELGQDLSFALDKFAQEEERKAGESRFLVLFETSPLPMVITHNSFTMLANQACRDMFGAPPLLSVSGNAVLDFVAPECLPALQERIRLRESGTPLSSSFQTTGRRLDGTLFPMAVELATLRMDDDLSILFFLRDISEPLRHEQEIRELNEGLERRVQERTLQLEAVNRDLAAFAYSVSHDLRAPLRHMEGFAGLLRKHLGGEIDPKTKHYVEVIQTSAHRMTRLVEDLLTYSRLGQTELRKVPLDLNHLLLGLLDPCLVGAEDRDIQWKIGPLPPLVGDPTLMSFLLQNLLSNAVKFTRHRAQAVIQIEPLVDADGWMGFEVRDNGAGFDPAHAGQLFGLFQRLHPEEAFEGTGIGLAHVQRIVKLHGGRVRAEGAVDQGAAFQVLFPPDGCLPAST